MTTKTKQHERITKAEIGQYVELSERKSQLNSELNAIESQRQILKNKIESFLDDADTNSVRLYGYMIMLKAGRRIVSWKNEFLKVAGASHAELVLKVAPRTREIHVTKEV